MAAAAASSDADKLAKLRALTDANLDESVGMFLLEISEGSVQAAAAQYREQQGYDQAPAPAPAPPSAPPFAPTTASRRTSIMDSSTSNRSSTTQGGRRMTTRTSVIGDILVKEVVRREPAMCVGPSMEPGGIVKGRDRGFARNSHFLDEGALCEPKLFSDQQLHSSMNSPMSIDHNGSSLDYAYGFSTPGAFNEAEDGDGYISRERRDYGGGWQTSPNPVGSVMTAGGGAAQRRDRRVSEQNYPTQPLAQGGGFRRCGTDTQRSRPPQQHHSRTQTNHDARQQQRQQLTPQESWTGRSIHAQPAHLRSSMMSLCSDISMGESLMGQVEIEDDIPPENDIGHSNGSNSHAGSDPRRRQSQRYNTEPMAPSTLVGANRRRKNSSADLNNFTIKDPKQRSSVDSSSFSNLSNSANSHSLLGDYLPDNGTDFDPQDYMGHFTDTHDHRKTGSRKHSPEAYPPSPRSDFHDSYQNDHSRSTSGSSARRQRHSGATTTTATMTSGSARHSSMSRAELTIQEERSHCTSNTSSSSLKPDPPGGTIKTPWLQDSAQHQSSRSPPLHDSKSAARETSTSPKRRARRLATVRAGVASPTGSGDQANESQNSNYQQSGKEVGRARATLPGVVSVSSTTSEEPSMPVLPDLKPTVQVSKSSEPDVKVRRAPATRPGVESVSNTAEEPDAKPSAKSAALQEGAVPEPDKKVRRAPATRPGVVSVSNTADEPTSKPNPPQAAVPGSDVKVRRGLASEPGAVSVSDTAPGEPAFSKHSKSPAAKSGTGVKVRRGLANRSGVAPDEASMSAASDLPTPQSAVPGSDVKVRRAPANRPGAVSVSNTAPNSPTASQSAQPTLSEPDAKVQRTSTDEPGAVNVFKDSDENPEPPSTKDVKDRLRRRTPAIRPGAVSEVGESSDPPRDSISSKDSKVRRAPASAPGAVNVTAEEPLGDAVVSLDAGRHVDEPHSDNGGIPAERKTRNGKGASEPGAVDVTSSADTMREKKEKEKKRHGTGKQKPTAPGVVHVTGAEIPSDEKDSKAKKSLKFLPTKPGAVSVTSSDDSSGNKKLSQIDKESSFASSEAGGDGDDMTANDSRPDPTIETPEDDDTASAAHSILAPQRKGLRPQTRYAPANLPIISESWEWRAVNAAPEGHA